MSISLSKKLLDLCEMASPFRDDFKKGFRVFANMERNKYGRVANNTRYVIGFYKPENRFGLYMITSAAYTYKVERVDDDGISSYEEFLLNSGYEEVYPDMKNPPKTEDKQEYGVGKQIPGTSIVFNDMLFHGSNDPFFPLIFQGKKELPPSSHLYSVKERKALSFSSDSDVSVDFGAYVFGYRVKNLNVYCVTPDQDDFDDIFYNSKVDALALPPGRYQEKEIALVNTSAIRKFELLGFTFFEGSFEMDFDITITDIRKRGVLEAIIIPALESKYGDGTIKSIIGGVFRGKRCAERYDNRTNVYTMIFNTKKSVVEFYFDVIDCIMDIVIKANKFAEIGEYSFCRHYYYPEQLKDEVLNRKSELNAALNKVYIGGDEDTA